ncbi:hypothetical protein CJO79_13160 [Ralstonia solanacearum]|nr:hypothetical protein CJO76_13180 [Ralstonia solanacearum]AXV91858.1 hypothetical protein CJO79_13160 [Ralstonia solanacearum]AXW76745.1 hypothetical protein CJO97_13150 [Ralstonia solanacearum]
MRAAWSCVQCGDSNLDDPRLLRKGLHAFSCIGAARMLPETLALQLEMRVQAASRQAIAQCFAAGQ